ncbi:hypothetical protein [Streptomyces sp. NPDC051183]|uniref:hypothetical protein n=1 Tax=Streptomyces sp. NPDC051183 TaxID=3155165 RepID=UPI0034197B51
MNQLDICIQAASEIAEGLGAPWTVGGDHASGRRAQIVHPDGLTLEVGAPRMHTTAYIRVHAVMPAGGEPFAPTPISARADRGKAIAQDVRRKLLPRYAEANTAARLHVLNEAWASARRREAAEHLCRLLPDGRWSSSHPDGAVTVTGSLSLPLPGTPRNSPVQARARLDESGATADLKIERLPLDVASKVVKVLAQAHRE